MQWYKADLHVHTVLSPCGDIDMSPVKIMEKALVMGLTMLGITDHNSTRHCDLMMRLGQRYGITVIPGAEVTTQEEIHCLALFENTIACRKFQVFLDRFMVRVKNKTEVFGYQLIVDENENILDEEENLLIVAVEEGIDKVEQEVHALGGIFIPAHIDRPSNSIMSQLGFIPTGLNIDAAEISMDETAGSAANKFNAFRGFTLIRNSDAHYLHQVGSNGCSYYMERPDFSELKKALKGENGRKVKIV